MKVYVLFHTDREDAYSMIDGVFSSFEKALNHKKKEWPKYNEEDKLRGAPEWQYTSEEYPCSRGNGFMVVIREVELDQPT